jgi:hypothetical protein
MSSAYPSTPQKSEDGQQIAQQVRRRAEQSFTAVTASRSHMLPESFPKTPEELPEGR